MNDNLVEANLSAEHIHSTSSLLQQLDFQRVCQLDDP